MDWARVVAQTVYLPSRLVIEADFPTWLEVEGLSMLRVLDQAWLQKQITAGDYVFHGHNARVEFLMKDAQKAQGIERDHFLLLAFLYMTRTGSERLIFQRHT